MAATTIKVWAKIENNEPEKVEIRSDADIDDLKNELFSGNKELKRTYYGIFNNVKLSSSTPIPHPTNDKKPILFVKIDENSFVNSSNNEDTIQVTVTHLDTVPDEELIDAASITSWTSNVNDTTFTTSTSSVSTLPVITNAARLPPHLVETIHYKNGDKYVGEINEKREPHGKGTMSWKNGRRYEGLWKNGKKHGLGTEYGANGAMNYSGEWKDDVQIDTSLNDE